MSEPTPEELRDRIAAERAELGRTAAALADRVDVGSRARAARDQATDQVKAGVGQATEQVKAGVGQAQEVGREVLTRTAGTAKQAVGTLDSALGGRDRTSAVAAGAGAALLAVLLLVLRRRRR